MSKIIEAHGEAYESMLEEVCKSFESFLENSGHNKESKEEKCCPYHMLKDVISFYKQTRIEFPFEVWIDGIKISFKEDSINKEEEREKQEAEMMPYKEVFDTIIELDKVFRHFNHEFPLDIVMESVHQAKFKDDDEQGIEPTVCIKDGKLRIVYKAKKTQQKEEHKRKMTFEDFKAGRACAVGVGSGSFKYVSNEEMARMDRRGSMEEVEEEE